MKKLTSILLSLVLVFSFAACSNNSSDNSNTTPSTSQTADASKSTDENTQNSNTSSKILVVYYSATGSTKAVALSRLGLPVEQIAMALQVDVELAKQWIGDK